MDAEALKYHCQERPSNLNKDIQNLDKRQSINVNDYACLDTPLESKLASNYSIVSFEGNSGDPRNNTGYELAKKNAYKDAKKERGDYLDLNNYGSNNVQTEDSYDNKQAKNSYKNDSANYNSLTGTIPSQFGLLTGLNILFLRT